MEFVEFNPVGFELRGKIFPSSRKKMKITR
jgi:hypothetical protein